MMKLLLVYLSMSLGTYSQNIGGCDLSTDDIWYANHYLSYDRFAGTKTLFIHYATSNFISPKDITALIEFKNQAILSKILGTRIDSQATIVFTTPPKILPWISGVGYPAGRKELYYVTVSCGDAYLTYVCDPKANFFQGTPTFLVSTMTNFRLANRSLTACMNITRQVTSKVKLEPLVYDR